MIFFDAANVTIYYRFYFEKFIFNCGKNKDFNKVIEADFSNYWKDLIKNKSAKGSSKQTEMNILEFISCQASNSKLIRLYLSKEI